MTEHRPPYHAFSGTTEAQHNTASPLEQYYVDGSISRDIILLMPIVQLPQESGNTCLHLVHKDSSNLGVCNTPTEQRCPCCGCFVCPEHQTPYGIRLPDAATQAGPFLFCHTCALLPLQTALALRAFRLLINEQRQVQP